MLSYWTALDIAEILLLGAGLMVLVDLMRLIKIGGRSVQNGFSLASVACILVVASYLILVQAFLLDNFLYEEVYLYSSSSLSVTAKLYASWASSSGSLLFLTFLYALMYLVVRFAKSGWVGNRKVLEILDFLLLFFIFIVLSDSPFRVLSSKPLDGQGLNPLLQSPWMLVHPPIVFIGYMLVFFSFAFTFGLTEKADDSATPVRVFSQLAWLFLSAGIAIGGLWAYEVLGWGGYWAWDPVETASLLPWLALTAYFHLTPGAYGKSSSRELMVMISSSMVIFATAVTRGGLAVSVHAFGSSPIGYALLGLMLATSGYFVYHQRKKGVPLFELNLNSSWVYSLSLALGFVSLIMITVVCTWGIVFPMIQGLIQGTSTGMEADFFNKWNYPFVILFLVALVGCQLSPKINVRRYLILASSALAVSVVLAAVGIPTPNALANFGFPILLTSLGAAAFGATQSVRRRMEASLGRSAIHLGVAVVLIGVFLSSTLGFDAGVLPAAPNSTLEIDGLRMTFGNFSVIPPFGRVFADDSVYPEAAGLEMPIVLDAYGSSQSGKLDIYLYPVHGVVSRPLIVRTLGYDVYIVLQQSDSVYFSLLHTLMGVSAPPTEFDVSVKTTSQVNLIWLGVAMMCIGMVLPLLKRHESGHPRGT